MGATATTDDELIILSDDDTTTEVSTENVVNDSIQVEETNNESDNLITFGEESTSEDLDFSDLGDTSTKSEDIVDSDENSALSDGLDIGISDDTSGDMNSIIDETISKLKSREDNNSSLKSKDLDNISNLKSQIKDLGKEVGGYEETVLGLDSENKRIIANIKKLEDMKISDVG